MAVYIPDDKIAAIKNASDIVDIVSDVVSLRRAGRNFLGLCPFHTEKTPSFTVSPEKQIFYCFGCGAGGNVFSFLMKNGGMTFPEAAKMLAGRYGIDLPTKKMSPAEKKKLTERETILTLNAEAMVFYQDCLFSREMGKKAMDYLLKRGMTRQSIEDFQLGFAPEGWDHLVRLFRSRKRSIEMALRSGLILKKRRGDGHYDRFRNRIIFPIFNAQGQLIGFGGRVLDDSLPKYLNGPETPVYNKRRSLFGVEKARAKSRQRQLVYVVEGYFDLIAMHHFGMENSVATLGTALSDQHVRLLKSFVGQGGKAVLVYDSDQAGINAAQRSVRVFQKGFLDARILVLPEGHDPDSFLRENGARAFSRVAASAMGMMTFMIESAVNQHGLSIDGKVHIVNDLKQALLAIDDPVDRSLHTKQLAERIGVEEPILLEKLRLTANRSGPAGRTEARAQTTAKERGVTHRMEWQMVAMMLQYPEIIDEIKKRRFIDHFVDTELAEIGEAVIDHFSTSSGDISDFVSSLTDAGKKATIARLSMIDEQWDRKGCLNLLNQYAESLRRRDKTLLQRIEAAEKSGDVDLLAELLQEKQHQLRDRMDTQSLADG